MEAKIVLNKCAQFPQEDPANSSNRHLRDSEAGRVLHLRSAEGNALHCRPGSVYDKCVINVNDGPARRPGPEMTLAATRR